jgi:hypothetical protein
MGDLMFNRAPALIVRAALSIKSWISILERASKKHGDATFIFGHAKPGLPVTGPAKELLYLRDYFTAVLDHVQKGIKAGRSQDEITKIAELPGFTEHISSGQVLTLAGTLTAAYEELTKK